LDARAPEEVSAPEQALDARHEAGGGLGGAPRAGTAVSRTPAGRGDRSEAGSQLRVAC